jgi:hypothetical protein
MIHRRASSRLSAWPQWLHFGHRDGRLATGFHPILPATVAWPAFGRDADRIGPVERQESDG